MGTYMKGNIKAYSNDVNAGVISGEDGNMYCFPRSEWWSKNIPVGNETVRFNPAGRHATKVTGDRKKG